MSSSPETFQSSLPLTLLRFSILATGSALAGVLAHIVWRAVTG